MINAILTGILNILATIVQAATYTIGLAISSVFPDLTDKITTITSTIVSFVNGMSWVLDIIPSSFKISLAFILTLEIAKLTVFKSTNRLIQLYNLFQRLKFW